MKEIKFTKGYVTLINIGGDTYIPGSRDEDGSLSLFPTLDAANNDRIEFCAESEWAAKHGLMDEHYEVDNLQVFPAKKDMSGTTLIFNPDKEHVPLFGHSNILPDSLKDLRKYYL